MAEALALSRASNCLIENNCLSFSRPPSSPQNTHSLILSLFSDGEWKLLLISQASSVGVLPHGGEVYCVERIAIIPLTKDSNPEIIGLEVQLKEREERERNTHTVPFVIG